MAGRSLSCPHCQRSVSLHSADSGYFICPHCRRGSNHAGGKLTRHTTTMIPAPTGAALAPGDALVVQGRHYTVGGVAQYRDEEGNRSTDYDLIGKGGEIVGLEEADGEWTLNRYLPNGERLVKKTGQRAELFKQAFTFDDRYPVAVTAAAGEFEEPIAAGDKARFDYYEGSEFGLTAELSPAGQVQAWYLSYAIRADEIRPPAGRKLSAATGIGERLSGILGLAGAAADKSSITRASPLVKKPATEGQIVRWSLIFAGIAILLHVLFIVTAQNKKVYDSGPRTTGAATQSSWISEPFELTGRRSNVQVQAQTNLSNQWMGYELALVNKTSGKVFHLYEDASHWHGYDGGERWSEGTPRPEFYFSSIPAGTYVLEVMTYADVPNIQYQLVLNRDVPRSSYLLYILIAFAALPGLHLLRRYAKN